MKRTAVTEDRTSPSAQGDHPLPLNLDFMFGKGFLWAEEVPLADWLTLESLRMEIPDLSFPFDAGGGVERFQNTRCQIREIEISVDESALADRLNRAVEGLDEFHDVRVRFLEDAAHVSMQLRAFGSETHLSFRAALLPPEPPRADEVHLSLYDYRWFGPLPYPGRLLAFEWLTGVLNTPLFSAPGRGRPFQVGVAGDIASLRPFKLLLVDLFPPHGWKLPNLSGVVLDDVHIQPGELKIRATSQDDRWQTDAEPIHEMRSSREGRRALAAYESKDLFAPADEALFGGHVGEALELLSNYREKYGLHPQLASRMLDCLLADPTASHLAEAQSICRQLQEENPEDLRGHLARPVMTLISEGEDEALDDYDALSAVLKKRGDTPDWVLSELAAADILSAGRPEEAADRLREVLKATPHSLPVLQRLRDLYQRLGRKQQLEDVLKRLTGVHTDRTALKETYLQLARHLMHREGELAEARHFLQKALKIDSENLEALETLGESYALSDKPMRAVKAFSSAARIAESHRQLPRARQLQFRIAGLWRDELDEPEQALLSVRRAISTTESQLEAASTLDRPQAIEFAGQLEFAAQLCEQLRRPEEALGHWSEAVSLLERLVDVDGPPAGQTDEPDPASPRGRLANAHNHLADLYDERNRAGAAESHWRRVLELDPTRAEVVDRLETHYKASGRPDPLVELLEERLEMVDDAERTGQLHRKMSDLLEALGRDEEADTHREQARRLAPAPPQPDSEESTAEESTAKESTAEESKQRESKQRESMSREPNPGKSTTGKPNPEESTAATLNVPRNDDSSDSLLGGTFDDEPPSIAPEAGEEADADDAVSSDDLLRGKDDESADEPADDPFAGAFDDVEGPSDSDAPADDPFAGAFDDDDPSSERSEEASSDKDPFAGSFDDIMEDEPEALPDPDRSSKRSRPSDPFGEVPPEILDGDPDKTQRQPNDSFAGAFDSIVGGEEEMEGEMSAVGPAEETSDEPPDQEGEAAESQMGNEGPTQTAVSPPDDEEEQEEQEQEDRQKPDRSASRGPWSDGSESSGGESLGGPASSRVGGLRSTSPNSSSFERTSPPSSLTSDSSSPASSSGFDRVPTPIEEERDEEKPFLEGLDESIRHGVESVIEVEDEADEADENDESDEPPAPVPRPGGRDTSDTEQQEEEEEPNLDNFRSEYKDLFKSEPEESDFGVPSPESLRTATEVASKNVEQRLREKSSVEELEEVEQRGRPEAEADDAEGARTVRAAAAPRAEERIRQARRADDPEELIEVLEEVLDAYQQAPASAGIDRRRALELRRELAELLYFEQEDGDRALPHLERLRRQDPDGEGAAGDVLRALESIYEERGDVEGRLEVLEARQDQSDDPEMADTYSMLIAQLHWEEYGDREAAKEWLRDPLDHDRTHEGAHRLLAEMAEADGEYKRAVQHLMAVSKVAGDGLDALEVERRLGDLLHTELAKPQAAADRFKKVLEGAPGDQRALEGLKTSQMTAGDWPGYLESLGHELGLLVGRTDGLTVEQMAELQEDAVPDDSMVAASQILVDAAQTAEHQLDEYEPAWRLYGAALRMWADNVDALERRVELDRQLDRQRALAEDLEALADCLLDADSRFGLLLDATEAWEQLGAKERALEVLERAIEAGEEAGGGSDRLDQARRRLDNAPHSENPT